MEEELKFYNCNPDCGGKPLCKLGYITDDRNRRYANTVQLKGASATEVLNKSRDVTNLDREYDIFIVGEAPGRHEDRSGIPFQGDAGKVLADFLAKAGFYDLDRVYVTNLVKCHPPKNRTPAMPEIKACNTHIEYEIKKYRPKVVMLLGKTTLKLFNLDKIGGIRKIHGQLYTKKLPGWDDGPDFQVIPTFHPAFFVHRPNPKMQSRIADDYRFANQVLKAKEGEKVYHIHYQADYTIADTVDKVRDMVNQIRERGIFAFDTESADARFMKSPMICAQFSIGAGKTWVLPFYNHDPEGTEWKLKPAWDKQNLDQVVDLLRLIFEDETIPKAAHNIKYDANVLLRWLNIRLKGWWWDTCVMHHLIDEYRPHDLETLVDIELGFGHYSEKLHEIVGYSRDELKVTYDNIPDEILWPYGATDVEGGWRLLEIYYERMLKRPHLLKLYSEESHDALKTLSKAEWNGCYMVRENVEALDKEYTKRIDDILVKCRSYSKPDFNPGSPDQVAEELTKLGFGDEVQKKEAAKGYTTAKDVLSEINHPLAQAVVEYRHVIKMKSTYVDNALENLDDEGRIRFPFMLHGTTSGRLSCRFLHQIPKSNKEELKKDPNKVFMRSIFGEPEGWTYFYADYSQVELRIFAILTGETDLINALYKSKTERNDGDIHALTAAGALGVDPSEVSDANRTDVGKRLNFGVIYGSEGFSVAKGTFENPKTGKKEVIGIDRALAFVRNFRAKYPKVDWFLNDIPDQALCQGGRLRSVFGRERLIHGLNDPDQKIRGHAEREATNFVVQSPAGAITIRTMNLVDKMLMDMKVGPDLVKLTNTVHDSISYAVRDDMVDWFTEAFTIIATRQIPEIDNYYFPVDIGVGRTWAEAEAA